MRRFAWLLLVPLATGACSPQVEVAAPGKATATHSPAGATVRPTVDLPGVVCEWATVRSITDGDTIRVNFDQGPQNQPVRYIGVDTPETHHPTLGEQPFGREAAEANAELVAGKHLCLERDLTERDRYGRLLRYLWLEDGTLVNERLVATGYAVVDTYPPDVKYVERFIAAQEAARAAGLGMWAE